MLFKAGLRQMPTFSIAAAVFNMPLIYGLALYGLSTVVLVLALRDGELSLLYPVISLTYAWVTILSFMYLGESVNPFKIAGLCTIILGVTLLGRTSKR
jgi:multidrug transporter EmrE-like cation transporter